MYVDEWKGEP
jgi:hypothetical protein